MSSKAKLKELPKYEKEELEKLILKLFKEGKKQSEIGHILRDQYGIPKVKIYGLSIREVIKRYIPEERENVPEDLFNLLKKAVIMYNHLQINKKDKRCRHAFQLVESKIRRLADYYIRKGVLPKDWRYSIEKAKLIVK
ncbi:MAG: 30S ribosomal protein S15 [Candidatus Aenigmatarchaeota archaeon]